ncbi:MAG: addiction module antidote protein [Burkholderiales bacterium]
MATSRAQSATGRHSRKGVERSRAHADYLRQHLADDKNAAALLNAALETGDEGDVMYALRAIAAAKGGVAQIAKATGLSRETLYRTLSRSGNPRLSTLLAVMRAAGVRLKAERAG